MDQLYGLTSEQYMKLNLESLRTEDLKELAYYLWCCFEEDEVLMAWRKSVLLPLVIQLPDSERVEEEVVVVDD